MTGKRPAAVINSVQDRLQRLLSAVAQQNQVTIIGRGAHRYTARPPLSERIRLRHRVLTHLRLQHEFVLVDTGDDGDKRWRAETTAYFYTLITPDDQELLAFHWHPEVTGRPDPHIHLGPASQAVGLLRESHIPASNISLEEVLAYAIRELRVEPARDDWAAILAAGSP